MFSADMPPTPSREADTSTPLERRQSMPQLVLIGVDHRTAPIELREKVSYGEDDGRALLESLVSDPAIAEASLLSTCNRVSRPRSR